MTKNPTTPPVETRGVKAEISVPGFSAKVDYTSPHEAVAIKLANDGNVDGAREVLNDKPGFLRGLFKSGKGDD